MDVYSIQKVTADLLRPDDLVLDSFSTRIVDAGPQLVVAVGVPTGALRRLKVTYRPYGQATPIVDPEVDLPAYQAVLVARPAGRHC